MSENRHAFHSISARKTASISVLCAMSLISFMLENLLPPLFLPGAKIGLSNIFTLFTLVVYTPIDAILLVIIRTTLGSIIVGNISSLIYSLSAGLCSIIISSILITYVHPKISLISISIVSAIIHNIIQTLVFSIITNSTSMLFYLPYFALIGILSGVIVGAVVYLVIHKLPINFFNGILYKNSKTNTLEKENIW